MYQYDASAQDAEGGTLAFELMPNQFPAGMTINQQTGLIAWTPAVGQDGTAHVELTVTDSAGKTATDSLTVDYKGASF